MDLLVEFKQYLDREAKRIKSIKPKRGAPFKHQGRRSHRFRCVVDTNYRSPLADHTKAIRLDKDILDRWSHVIRARDVMCQCCQERQSDVAHHLLFKSTTPALALSSSNGMGLCYYCHDEIHYSRTTVGVSRNEICNKYGNASKKAVPEGL